MTAQSRRPESTPPPLRHKGPDPEHAALIVRAHWAARIALADWNAGKRGHDETWFAERAAEMAELVK